MKNRAIHALACLAFCALVLVPATAGAQEQADLQEPTPEQMQEMWAKWMATTQPSEHHKHLEYFVGEWDITMRMWMEGSDNPPIETTGSVSARWIMGDRYVQSEFSGRFEMPGMPASDYTGISYMGYDNYKNLYTALWLDDQSTMMLTSQGSRNPVSGNIDLYGVMDEPMLDVHQRMVRYYYRMVDEDTFVFESYDLHAGPDYKVFEMEHRRRK